MSKILILVEGQAEETFVREVLAPYLSRNGVYPIAKLATTKRVKSGPHFKGGIVSYYELRLEWSRVLRWYNSTRLIHTMVSGQIQAPDWGVRQ